MADMIDTANDGIPFGKRLRMSIKWRSIKQRWMFPGEAYSELEIGFFVGAMPLFSDALYRPASATAGSANGPGYFSGEDDNCGILTGVRDLLAKGTPMDLQDFAYPLFRLIIAADAFDRTDVDRAPVLFDVVAIMQAGAVCHGGMISNSGPAMLLNVTPRALGRFYDDLVSEALDPAVCDEESRDIIKRFVRPVVGETNSPSGQD